MDYTASGLIDSIKLRAFTPTNQSTFTTDRFVTIINEQLIETVVPLILRTREEFFVYNKDYTITTDNNVFEIPSEALGKKLRNVSAWENVTYPNGDYGIPYGGTMLNTFDRIPPELVYQSTGFYIENNSLIIYPSTMINNYQTLRLSYYRRPNTVVYNDDAGEILIVNQSGINQYTLTLSNVPVNWVATNTIDIISPDPSFGIVLKSYPLISIDAINNQITLTSNTLIQVGQWVCLAGESVFAQIPAELYGFLAQACAVKCLEGLGDMEKISIAQVKLNELSESALTVLKDRVESSQVKKVSDNNLADWI